MIRNVLFTPWRNSYIKKTLDKIASPRCVFCDAIEKGISLETLLVFKGHRASVILNKFPYNNGHTMIIPHEHSADLSALDQETFIEMHELLKKTYQALKQEYNPGGLNIGMNIGKTGGAGITDHLHYHLVPRWDGDSNFMPILSGTKVVPESLDMTYEKLRKYFESRES